MVWTNNQIYSGDPFDWSIWLFTLLSLSVTASLVMFIWNRIRKAVDDGGHTSLIYHLLKAALVFQLIPFSTILVKLFSIAEKSPEGVEVGAFFPTPALIYFGRLLAVAWVAGILVRIGKLSKEMRLFRRFKARCVPADEDCLALFDQCRAQLGIRRKIPVLKSADLHTPLLNGLFKPVVIIPEEMEIPDEALKCAFQHELVHYRQKDILFKKLAAVSECVHWFNPLIRGRMLSAVTDWVEYYCDETVCGICDSRKTYYVTLRDTALRCSGQYLFRTALCSGKNELLTRVERMEKERVSKKIGKAAVTAMAVILLLAGTVTSFGTGLGAVKVHQAILSETLNEEFELAFDEETIRWYRENACWEDDVIRPDQTATKEFECSVPAGTLRVSRPFVKNAGETIRVEARIAEDVDANIGIITPGGKTVFVKWEDSMVHTFTAEETGEYLIAVDNPSASTSNSTTIHVTGVYE
ncbi:MAG: hypothetical protein J5865_00555 [Lachnospiraceae bacterium]|nr:hypothetical protein [Lachnospiraceae bacterium]